MERRTLLHLALIFGIDQTIFANGWQTSNSLLSIENELKTIENIQEIILPSSHKYPGAKEINAIGFIKVMIHGKIFSKNEADYLTNGANTLNITTYKKYKKTFNELSKITQENFLKIYIQKKKNLRWLKTIKRHTLYALVSDPIYGGNKNQLGWEWLKVVEPKPRPVTRLGR